MRIEADRIGAPATQSVMAMLEEGGHQALFVGGCVRNALLGAPVKDIDIATDARPERVLALAGAAGLKAVPTGMDHGTITVVADGQPHEITTFRRDVQGDGRHAVIAYSDDIAEDARRRDFTMNALYARRDGTVIDPLGGLPDLRAHRVRFIEDPASRIREDYLRILRYFRFHAWYGDPQAGMDPEALAAIAVHLEGLDALSRERVGAEITRLLTAPDPAPAVAAMRQAGALDRVLPGADDRALAPLVHLEQQIAAAPDAIRRLAALGGDDAQARLRLSKPQARRLAVLRDGIGSGLSPLELGYRHGSDAGRSILLLRGAVFETGALAADLISVDHGAQAVFPVKAADLTQGFSGPALGAELARLEEDWLASDCRATKDDLLKERPDDG